MKEVIRVEEEESDTETRDWKEKIQKTRDRIVEKLKKPTPPPSPPQPEQPAP